MPCLIRRTSKLINQFVGKHFKSLFAWLLVFSCFFLIKPFSALAKLETFNNDDGVRLSRSIESLRDLESQTWQIVVYNQNDDNEHMVLRIVGFTGSLRLNHPTILEVKSGIKSWNLRDITLENLELANDNRDAVVEFELEPLLIDLENNRPLRLSLTGAFSELPVPPYVVKEWRLIKDFDLKDEK